MTGEFNPRVSIEQVEEGNELAPKFDNDGLIPAVTTDYNSGELLMQGYMNAEAFRLTIETSEAHYFSRSRGVLWHKGGKQRFFLIVHPCCALFAPSRSRAPRADVTRDTSDAEVRDADIQGRER